MSAKSRRPKQIRSAGIALSVPVSGGEIGGLPTSDRVAVTEPAILTFVAINPDDYFELSLDELREVARYAAEGAERALVIFEEERPGDRRPRAAIDAARAFANGSDRTNVQRVTASDAHGAAKEATTEAAQHAAKAAGAAAAAAYLHPFARASQVGHILRAAAHAAYAVGVAADDASAGDRQIAEAASRATPVLRDVLSRYPAAPTGNSRVADLMKRLDTALRTI